MSGAQGGKDNVEGVLVVDKPRGPTSHDVVARLRRALGTKRIGHAGTLDPMASGVLVVLVGEATKLAGYLTAQDKRYEARVALGVGTDTLDAEGKVTETRPIPGWLAEEIGDLERAPRIAAAIAAERARRTQVPPAHSAIQVGGRRSYALARAGQAVELAPRPVEVRSIALRGASRSRREGAPPSDAMPELTLELEVSKGYYVRSLARDLGEHLEVPAHLTALRRTASGAFTLDRAVALDALCAPSPGDDALRRALLPLAEAAAIGLPTARLTEAGAQRARLGQRLRHDDFDAPPPLGDTPDDAAAAAWLAPDGRVVALGSAWIEGGEPRYSVLRGFSS